jgi:hypothetical protein
LGNPAGNFEKASSIFLKVTLPQIASDLGYSESDETPVTDQRPPGTQIPVEGAVDDEARYPVREKRRPWDRQPEEPVQVFKIFLRWLALNERTIPNLHPFCPQAAPKQLAQLHDRFDWAFRSERYDTWRASLSLRSLEDAESKEAADLGKMVHRLAVTAVIAVQRNLEVLQEQKRTRYKRDSHGKIMVDESGKRVLEPNPHYAPDRRLTLDLAKTAVELTRLIQGQPGSIEETERKRQADELLKKLDAMAQAVSPRSQSSDNGDRVEEQVQH